MKYLIFLISLLFCVEFVSAQNPAPLNFACKFNVIYSSGSNPYILKGYILDETSAFNGTNVSIGDSIYCIEGSDLLILGVQSIQFVMGQYIELTAFDNANTTIFPSTGMCGISKNTANIKLPFYIAGLNQDLMQMIMNRQTQLIDAYVAAAGGADGNGIYGGNGNVPASTVASMLGDFKLSTSNTDYTFNDDYLQIQSSGSEKLTISPTFIQSTDYSAVFPIEHSGGQGISVIADDNRMYINNSGIQLRTTNKDPVLFTDNTSTGVSFELPATFLDQDYVWPVEAPTSNDWVLASTIVGGKTQLYWQNSGTSYEEIVEFNTTSPNSGSPTFIPNTPADPNLLYVSTVNGSTWIWKASTSTYITYNVPSRTPFFLANTTTDAGNNKTASIYRNGRIGIRTNNPTTDLHINPIAANASGLRLEKLTSASPATATIGYTAVSANGTVVRAQDPLLTEVDGSITNELQTLSQVGSTITLSNGGGSVTAIQTEVDGNITNELQTISSNGAAGNITLSNGGGTLNLNVNDADASATNEGSLSVAAGTATTSIINSNTSGSTGVTLAVSTGLSIAEAVSTITLTNTGDTDASNDLTTATSFAGDVSGLWNNLQLGTNVVGSSELASTGVAAGVFSGVTYDVDGRATSTNSVLNIPVPVNSNYTLKTNAGVTGVEWAPNNPVLSSYTDFGNFVNTPITRLDFVGPNNIGTYMNPISAGHYEINIVDNNIPGLVGGSTYGNGSTIEVPVFTINAGGKITSITNEVLDINPFVTPELPFNASGLPRFLWQDGAGGLDWLDINQLQGIPIAATAPTNGQTLAYNSTTFQYEPTTISGGGGATDLSFSVPAANQAQINSSTGTDVILKGSSTATLTVSGATTTIEAIGEKIEIFGGPGTTAGVDFGTFTWTKDPDGKWFEVYVWSAGGGGGSGRASAVAEVRSGGGSGGSGGLTYGKFFPSELGATETVLVRAGGAGGAAATAPANGNTVFMTIEQSGLGATATPNKLFVRSANQAGGGGGIGTNGSAGSAVSAAGTLVGVAGALSSALGAAGTNATLSATDACYGSASGGGITATNVFSAGGSVYSGSFSVNITRSFRNVTTNVGGIAGSLTVNGGNGSDGFNTGGLIGGTGGSGGGSGLIGGNGGKGGWPGGGGGGGGAGITASGAGGAGANGAVIIITHY